MIMYQHISGSNNGWHNKYNMSGTDSIIASGSDGEIKYIAANNAFYVYKYAEMEVGTLYAQTAYVPGPDDSYNYQSKRFVALISEESAASATSVVFSLTNGVSEVTRTSTKCYSSVSVAGSSIVAPEGYVFVAFAVTNIPNANVNDVTATYTLE